MTNQLEKYSFSKLSTIWQCPYQYYLNYIEHDYDKRENGFSQCGSLVHSLLEKFLNGEIDNPAEVFLNTFYQEVPNGIILDSNGFKRDLTEKYKEECYTFLNEFYDLNDLFQRWVGKSLNFEVVGTEHSFDLTTTINDKEIRLTGIIDLLLKDDKGNFYIADWKSKSAFKKTEVKNYTGEFRKYGRQLYMYAMYVKEKYGVFPKKLYFIQFRIGEIQEIEFNEDDYNETLQWIYDTVIKIEDEFMYTPILDEAVDEKDFKDKAFFCSNLCSYGHKCKAINKEEDV